MGRSTAGETDKEINRSRKKQTMVEEEQGEEETERSGERE